ncbi:MULTISPECIES: ribbon-helix-helix domain-containing protein [unclassified Yoonia]|uniref:ribbon-helix-helix domain-containing protein n=1 Tax=unclassified Yoonia TaxID=2629118 RepID=UPI002AFF87AB|nr:MULTISPECIES: ribbon-helix-helix domain-containing protein [unclassified Yoonia]
MTHQRPAKRSLTLRGHRTSVTLEDIFWKTFCNIAAEDHKTINGLAAEIDANRGDIGLASAIRIHVLERCLARIQSFE